MALKAQHAEAVSAAKQLEEESGSSFNSMGAIKAQLDSLRNEYKEVCSMSVHFQLEAKGVA